MEESRRKLVLSIIPDCLFLPPIFLLGGMQLSSHISYISSSQPLTNNRFMNPGNPDTPLRPLISNTHLPSSKPKSCSLLFPLLSLPHSPHSNPTASATSKSYLNLSTQLPPLPKPQHLPRSTAKA